MDSDWHYGQACGQQHAHTVAGRLDLQCHKIARAQQHWVMWTAASDCLCHDCPDCHSCSSGASHPFIAHVAPQHQAELISPC